MAVHPEHARRGLGRRMLTELENRAQALGCAEIQLNARAEAAGFYRRHGYADSGPGPLLFGCIEHVRMCKALA